MNKFFRILKYILNNNPWYLVPKRLIDAFFFQCHKRFSKRILVKRLFNGNRIYLFPQNPIASSLVYGEPDQNEINCLRHYADNQTVFLDIGANIGAYCLLIQDKVKEVYAFEAHPKTAMLCKINFELNHLDPNHVLSYAVSEDNQTKQFTNLSDGSPINSRASKHQNTIEVPAITLDAFVLQKKWDSTTPFIIKIDVEGFEHEVFYGAQRFLSHYNVRAIIFENFSCHQNEILSMLHKNGFETKLIGEHNTLAIPTRDPHAT